MALLALLTTAAIAVVVAGRGGDDDLAVLGSTQGEPTLFVSPNGSASATGRTASAAVSTIQDAIDRAEPGDVIQVSAGSYQPFAIRDKQDLAVVGLPGATISDGRYDRTAAVQVVDSSHIRIEGLELRASLFGVTVKGSSHTVIRGLAITDIGQEGILVNGRSHSALIENNTISLTGRRPGQDSRFAYAIYGEGIYLGDGSVPGDTTHNVIVRNNDISRTTAEAIDVKAYVYDVLIEGNRVHDIDTNTSGAVVVGIGAWSYPHADVIIQDNLIWNISSNSPYMDGNGISASADALITGNVIWGTEHFGILLDGNFHTSDTRVVVESNAIFQTGRQEIWQWNEPAPGELVARDNLTGAAATSELGGSSALAGGTPSQALLDLLTKVSGRQPQPTTSTTVAPSTTVQTTDTRPPSTPSTTLPVIATTEATSTRPTTSSSSSSNAAETSATTSNQPPPTASGSEVPSASTVNTNGASTNRRTGDEALVDPAFAFGQSTTTTLSTDSTDGATTSVSDAPAEARTQRTRDDSEPVASEEQALRLSSPDAADPVDVISSEGPELALAAPVPEPRSPLVAVTTILCLLMSAAGLTVRARRQELEVGSSA